MPPVRSPPALPLVDYPSSSPPPGNGSTVVNDSSSESIELATTDGAQAVNLVDNSAVGHGQDALPSSLLVPQADSKGAPSRIEDVVVMMRELEEMSGRARTPTELSGEEEVEDLESLHKKLKQLLMPSPKPVIAKPTAAETQPVPPFVVGPTLQRIESDRKRDHGISRNVLYYAAALQLEKAGVKWEIAQAWTAYLFSAGATGHDAVREKQQLVEEAKAELDALIKQVLDEEAAYWANQEKVLLPRRLLLSNISAGADAEEVASFLSEFKYDIQNIKMLARDPLSRTQTAYVDMYTQGAAKQASYSMGSIFGLIVKIRLAADGD
ncbi:uncharacterized protein N0V89_012307 [Didymosphaeria variabile]|uniref:Uncharacterized protein n=1 Tax=Didymosphaeria variabile TaxID=1932322 RepID=A0A9W9C4B8_9PLEO|nr:uncharacterized protein N0V89_012307 [Didymosphaeria variabile]KAJ4344563.1 hypothetical protein N0V89_012307 [Didymosphaeria variabile]